MKTISLCMIVKNEEEVLSRCLDAAREVADEIIIVDTGSTDRTKEIAAEYTDKIYDFAWIDDFSAARNLSFSKASSEYIMWLDADDVLEEENIKKIKVIKADPDDPDVYMLKYNLYDGGGKLALTYYRERILKRSRGFIWQEPVHESITPAGRIVYAEAAVSHRKLKPPASGRNLKIYESRIASGDTLSPRAMFYYSRELMHNGRSEDAITGFQRFLDEGKGWVENNIEACRNLAQCLLRNRKSPEALAALYKSFDYASPRAEVLCDIGSIFMSEKKHAQAVFFYESALGCSVSEETGAFIDKNYYGFIPNIQLCVCWYNMGDFGKAAHYNEKAAEYFPEHPSVLSNRQFFNKK